MKVLVTGARGFVGKNLCSTLRTIAQGKNPTVRLGQELTVLEYDTDTPPERLDEWCASCDFVIHLAGVNRPKEQSEFMTGNFGFTSQLLAALERSGNHCPILLSSSVQAALDNPYGKSKLAGERLLREYGERTGATVLIYRFVNLFGKWCRPNYNSVVATFCYNIARGLPIELNPADPLLRVAYIDDVVAELLCALQGTPHRNGEFCELPLTYEIRLSKLAQRLRQFRATREKRTVPELSDPLTVKLWATYLSYLPKDALSYPLQTHSDRRGSFTEIFRTQDRGQFSVNISKPGVVKGNHWHHTKNEKFMVASGVGVVRLRRIDSDDVAEYYVSGEHPEIIDIPVGYTHNIENLGQNDMVTVMWASECFDPERPDTYSMEV